MYVCSTCVYIPRLLLHKINKSMDRYIRERYKSSNITSAYFAGIITGAFVINRNYKMSTGTCIKFLIPSMMLTYFVYHCSKNISQKKKKKNYNSQGVVYDENFTLSTRSQ